MTLHLQELIDQKTIKLSLVGITLLIVLALITKAPFSAKTKVEAKIRAGNCSEISGQPATLDDPLQVHHIVPQHDGGSADLLNAIVVKLSEHALIHKLTDGVPFEKWYKSVPSCTEEAEDSVLYWLQHTGQMLGIYTIEETLEQQQTE